MPPELKISSYEWKIAQNILANQEDGLKLPHTLKAINGKLVPRPGYLHLANRFKLKHSFIKINGQIYGIAQGKDVDARIPHGSMSRVKYAVNQQGNVILLKITKNPQPEEAMKMIDLGQSFGATKRQGKSKYYVTTKYLGTNLKDYLKQPRSFSTLTDNKRIDIAIKLSWELHRLHHGLASKIGTGYAHLDLKLDNIVIDSNDKISIIDYGLSETNPQDIGIRRSEAHQYMPAFRDQTLTKEQIDIVSLKRVLFTPNSFHCSYGWVDRKYNITEFLLPEYLLKQYDLFDLISTYSKADELPDYHQQHISALDLAAIMITKVKQLSFSNEQIRSNKMLAYTLVYLYMSKSEQEFKKTLINPIKVKLIGLLYSKNKIHELNTLLNDLKFCNAIFYAQSFDAVNALYQLHQLSLEEHYQKTAISQDHAIAILACVVAYGINELQLNAIQQVFNNDNLAKALTLLEQHKLSHYYQEVIQNNHLANCLGSINNSTCQQAVSVLLLDKDFHLDNIYEVAKNAKIANMVITMQQNSFFIDSARYTSPFNGLLQNKFAIKAFEVCSKYNISSKMTSSILRSPQLSITINLLEQLGIANIANIEAVKADTRLTVLINKNLHSLPGKTIASLKNQLNKINLSTDASKNEFLKIITARPESTTNSTISWFKNPEEATVTLETDIEKTESIAKFMH